MELLKFLMAISLLCQRFSLYQMWSIESEIWICLHLMQFNFSKVGTAVTNALINARKAVDKSSEGEVENVPILSTSVAYGVYMAVSSNLRYEFLTTITLFKPWFAIIGLSLKPTLMSITHYIYLSNLVKTI